MLILNKIIFLRQVLLPLIQTAKNRPFFFCVNKGWSHRQHESLLFFL